MRRVTATLTLVFLLAGLFPMSWAQAIAPASNAAAEASAPDAVIYFWDFEGNNGGFAGTRDWEWGTYAWDGSTCDSSNYPPPAAHSGSRMWGTVLNTCYSNLGNNQGYNTCANTNPNDDSILSVSVDLAGVTPPVTLRWWEWYDLFSYWDWAEVYANGVPVFQHCEPSFVQPTAWVQQAVDLSAYAGGSVTIEFHIMASTVVNHAGWFIDDVMITGEVTQLPIVWDKTIDGLPWVPDMEITRQTSDTISTCTPGRSPTTPRRCPTASTPASAWCWATATTSRPGAATSTPSTWATRRCRPWTTA